MEQNKDYNSAESLFERTLRRPQFKKSKKVWMAYHGLKLRMGDINGAKAQLARSMQALSRHKHVEVISKYALTEFECGNADRGRVLFEELLSAHPKRTDIWNIYVDKEMKLNNITEARHLFERMIATNMFNAKNAKIIFKKYLEFEVRVGTVETQEMVKQKAREYVQRLA